MKIKYELYGKCIWHSDCIEGNGSGIMVVEKSEAKRDLMKCLHCGARGYYPVGQVGEIEVVNITSAMHSDSEGRCTCVGPVHKKTCPVHIKARGKLRCQ